MEHDLRGFLDPGRLPRSIEDVPRFATRRIISSPHLGHKGTAPPATLEAVLGVCTPAYCD